MGSNIPTAETMPEGLDAYFAGVWRHALKAMKAQKTWTWEQRPLLDEYVFALIHAKEARLEGETKPWDTHSKRASVLADQLALTPRGLKAVKAKEINDADDDADPFAGLDELQAKRKTRASA
jgi:hypothetical protein